MKKLLSVATASLAFVFAANAQVLPKEQMKNTAWTGFGAPINGDLTYYGFTDTFQARFDRGKFTVEGMLNWSFLANYDNEGNVDNFVFGTSNLNPLSLKYGVRDWDSGVWAGENKVSGEISEADKLKIKADGHSDWLNYNDQANVSNTVQDSYYVNFIYHITKNFDFGVGTKLNWQVGPAPRYGSWLWESDAHVRQGGFSTSYDDRAGAFWPTSMESVGTYKYTVDRPGSADVVGFVPYANKYAKRALGIRFIADKNFFELGAALPNGFNTDDPAVNCALRFSPSEWLSMAAVLEGAFDDGANFYSGATLGMDVIIFEFYFAADSLFTSASDDQAYGTGATIQFTIPNTRLSLKPELGINLFQNDNYDFAWYTGGTLSIGLTKELTLDIWSSFAQGSKDKRWADYKSTEDWNGGHVFDLRPELSFTYSKNTSFAVYVDFEQRTAFDGISRKCWSSGVYWTYTF